MIETKAVFVEQSQGEFEGTVYNNLYLIIEGSHYALKAVNASPNKILPYSEGDVVDVKLSLGANKKHEPVVRLVEIS